MNSKTFGNGKTHFTLALMAAMGLGMAAHSTHADEAVRQRVVRYADLNTNTPAGAVVLYRRITRAATEVCEQANSGDLHVAAAMKDCQVHAIRAAVMAVKNPMLTRQYEAANHLAPTPISIASLP
jgi:UrcA family protein